MTGEWINRGYQWAPFRDFGLHVIPRTTTDAGGSSASLLSGLSGVIYDEGAGTAEPWVYVEPFINFNGNYFVYLTIYFGFPFELGITDVDKLLGEPSSLLPTVMASDDFTTFAIARTEYIVNKPGVDVVVMGDSYSSGEGLSPFVAGTVDNCRRSWQAYATGIRPPTGTMSFHQLDLRAKQAPGSSEYAYGTFSWKNVACSGAKVVHVTTTDQYLGVQGPQIDEIDSETDLIILTIGGNDAFFEQIATMCVTSLLDNCAAELSGPNRQDTWGQYIFPYIRGDLRDKVRDAYVAIKTRAPRATVMAMGYPLALPETLTGVCDGAPSFSTEDAAFLRNVGLALNGALAGAAADAGVHFVPVADGFEDHHLCLTPSEGSWIGGVRYFINRQFSLHPTPSGHRYYARRATQKLQQLTDITNGYGRGFWASGMPKNP